MVRCVYSVCVCMGLCNKLCNRLTSFGHHHRCSLSLTSRWDLHILLVSTFSSRTGCLEGTPNRNPFSALFRIHTTCKLRWFVTMSASASFVLEVFVSVHQTTCGISVGGMFPRRYGFTIHSDNVTVWVFCI